LLKKNILSNYDSANNNVTIKKYTNYSKKVKFQKYVQLIHKYITIVTNYYIVKYITYVFMSQAHSIILPIK